MKKSKTNVKTYAVDDYEKVIQRAKKRPKFINKSNFSIFTLPKLKYFCTDHNGNLITT